MSAGYERVEEARFTVEHDEIGEFVRIRARRQLWPMVFLPIWLAGWTAAGVFAVRSVLSDFNQFLVVWLCGWAWGWLAVAGTLVWMFTGSQTLRVTGGDLEIGMRMFGWSRRRLFEGAKVRNLAIAPQDPRFFYRPDSPFFWRRSGAVKFDYGARTIYAGAGLDEAEARLIVERLERGLGPGAIGATGEDSAGLDPAERAQIRAAAATGARRGFLSRVTRPFNDQP